MSYIWTQKAEDDFVARHPNVNRRKILRKAGEPAMYDGKPLKTGSISRAFKMRGWIEQVVKKKAEMPKENLHYKLREFHHKVDAKTGALAPEADKKLWLQLRVLYEDGHNLMNAAKITGYSMEELNKFIRTRRSCFAHNLGDIHFEKNNASSAVYVPTFLLSSGMVG